MFQICIFKYGLQKKEKKKEKKCHDKNSWHKNEEKRIFYCSVAEEAAWYCSLVLLEVASQHRIRNNATQHCLKTCPTDCIRESSQASSDIQLATKQICQTLRGSEAAAEAIVAFLPERNDGCPLYLRPRPHGERVVSAFRQ